MKQILIYSFISFLSVSSFAQTEEKSCTFDSILERLISEKREEYYFASYSYNYDRSLIKHHLDKCQNKGKLLSLRSRDINIFMDIMEEEVSLFSHENENIKFRLSLLNRNFSSKEAKQFILSLFPKSEKFYYGRFSKGDNKIRIFCTYEKYIKVIGNIKDANGISFFEDDVVLFKLNDTYKEQIKKFHSECKVLGKSEHELISYAEELNGLEAKDKEIWMSHLGRFVDYSAEYRLKSKIKNLKKIFNF